MPQGQKLRVPCRWPMINQMSRESQYTYRAGNSRDSKATCGTYVRRNSVLPRRPSSQAVEDIVFSSSEQVSPGHWLNSKDLPPLKDESLEVFDTSSASPHGFPSYRPTAVPYQLEDTAGLCTWQNYGNFNLPAVQDYAALEDEHTFQPDMQVMSSQSLQDHLWFTNKTPMSPTSTLMNGKVVRSSNSFMTDSCVPMNYNPRVLNGHAPHGMSLGNELMEGSLQNKRCITSFDGERILF